MKKPLWKFFCKLRETKRFVLSVDQYVYFQQAFQELPFGQLRHPEELREFCKIFWLKQSIFEQEFNLLYEAWVPWGEIEELLRKQTTIEGEEDPAPTPTDTSEGSPPTPTTEPEGGKGGRELGKEDQDLPPIGDTDEPPQDIIEPKDANEFLDFELVIDEQTEGVDARDPLAMLPTRPFKLNDQAIMPFDLRYVAQRLRRKVESSVKTFTDELDLEEMIQQYCQYRYIDEVIYKAKDSSDSHIILLADRFGSMLAYEFIEHQFELSLESIPNCDFEHYTFYNLPSWNREKNSYDMQNMRKRNRLFQEEELTWNPSSWFFVFSDAGAHSGMVNRGRMRDSLKLWNYLKSFSSHVYWINPVPQRLRKGTTAQRLNLVIPMIYPHQTEWVKFFNR